MKNQVMALSNRESSQAVMGTPKKPVGAHFFPSVNTVLKEVSLEDQVLKFYEIKEETLAFEEHYFKSERKVSMEPVTTLLMSLLTNSS